MPTVRYGDFASELLDGESALDALLRSGAPVAFSCKAGSCGSCMVRALDGDVPGAAQTGMKDAWKARGYLLACVCRPEGDLTLGPVDSDTQVAAHVAAIAPLSHDVLQVDIALEAPFEFHAGQYVTLLRSDGLARSYSISNLPSSSFPPGSPGALRTIQLHVRLLPNGRMSEWLRTGVQPGEPVRILGPSGDCFYVPGKPDQPLILAGTGTGLAPLYGILADALAQDHTGPIHLFHGALRESGLYLVDELTALSAAHDNVIYTATLLDRDGPLDQVVLKTFAQLHAAGFKPAEYRAYLCGDPALVQGLRKKLFLAGMDLRQIHADSFLPAASAPPS